METCSQCGGSKQSGYVQRLIAENKLNPSLVSNPSKYIKAMPKPTRKLRKAIPKPDLNKPATIIQTRVKEWLSSRKKMNIFYSKLTEFLNARNTTRAYRAFLKENPDFDRDFVNSLVGTQKGMDFYPTPEICLSAHKEIISEIKTSSKILEPTAGLGSMVHFISKTKKPSTKVDVNELNKLFIEPLKKFFPKFNITQENFLEQSTKNDYDLIICNPPFSIGKDKKAYLDFFLKCCYMLNISETRHRLRSLIFICPPLVSKENYWKDGSGDNTFDPQNIFSKIPFDRINKMSEELTGNKLNKKAYENYNKEGDYEAFDKKGNDLVDDDERLEFELFIPYSGEWLGACKGFGGTSVSADIYRFIFT